MTQTVRIWLLALAIGVAASLGMVVTTITARAQECSLPVAGILAAAEAQGISDRIEVIYDVAFINAYTKHLGMSIPDGSEPIGVIFVLGELPGGIPVYRIGLIEPNGCIVHHGVLPAPRHLEAMRATRPEA